MKCVPARLLFWPQLYGSHSGRLSSWQLSVEKAGAQSLTSAGNINFFLERQLSFLGFVAGFRDSDTKCFTSVDNAAYFTRC
jgi:hypothetical protein